MKGNIENRLARLEAQGEPKVLGYWHFIYARDMADFERQRAALIGSGRAKATDLIIDANWQSWQQRGWSADAPEYLGDVREPETHAITRTWAEMLDGMADKEPRP